MTDEPKKTKGFQLDPAGDDTEQDFNIDYSGEISQDTLDRLKKATNKLFGNVAETSLQLNKVFNNTLLTDEYREAMRGLLDRIPAVKDLLDDLDELEPYIKAELEKPEYTSFTFDQIQEHTAPELLAMLQDPNSDFAKAMRAAKNAAQRDGIPVVRYKKSNEVQTSTDKLTNVFYSLTAPKPKGTINGQREMIPLKYEGNGGKKEVTVYYDYAFNEDALKSMGLDTKLARFTDFDFFVMTALDNLYMQGNQRVSLAKVFREMGNTGAPSDWHLDELEKSMTLGLSTILCMDDEQAQRAWGNIGPNDKYTEIRSPVMPIQILSSRFVANGKLADSTIVINSISPLTALARSLGHFSTWDKSILSLYTGRKTKRYYSVLRFLMIQIGWMRNPNTKRNNKIKFQTLYNHADEKTTRDKQAAKKMLYRLLDEVFIPAGYVKSYREDIKGDPGVLIYTTKNPQLPSGKK